MRAILYICILALFVSCNDMATNKTVKYTFQGPAFGTTYSISLYSDTPVDFEQGIDSVLYRINRSVSTYMPKSDISKINRGDSTIVVDQIFKDVFTLSKKIHKESQGYFDPTVGVLRNAYGFGDIERLQEIDATVLDSLHRLVGFDKVDLKSDGTINKNNSNIYLDFNAIAKGYGIDRIGHYFEEKGVENYLILLGGEVLAKGENLEKETIWTAGVEALDSEVGNQKAAAVINLQNKAMAGSGNYRKFRIDPTTKKKYVHTINPITGLAQESDLTSATILANTCAAADAYATACMALGYSKAVKLLSELDGVEGYLTFVDEDSKNGIYITKGFETLLLK